MKAVINGVRYDTAKAALIGEADNLGRGVESVTDFKYWSAGLYRTPRSGRYFLAGEGGPMTRFSRSTGNNSWAGGAKIIPLDEEDALAWAEENLPAEVIERHFAGIEDA